MPSTITTEVVGQDSTELLIDTDLTPTELARVESLETKLRMADATVLEQRIIQGETLFRIQQERLYRSRKPGERYTWEEYLQKFTPQLTTNGKGFKLQAAQCRQLMYLMHSKQIPSWDAHGGKLPLPTGVDQLQPLLGKAPVRNANSGGGFDMSGNWSAVAAIWKGANAKQLNPDRTAVSAARSHFETQQLRAGADPGRMMSEARRASLETMHAARASASAPAVSAAPPTPTPDYSPKPESQPEQPVATGNDPTIAAWEIQTDDSSIDAGAECKRISQTIQSIHRSIAELRGMLHSNTQRFGSDYLNFLRQVDAGVYSLNNIDDHVEQMAEDIEAIQSILSADVAEGELSQSTVDVDSFPTRA